MGLFNAGVLCAQKNFMIDKTLKDEGIEYLRKYLNIPAEVLPKTYKQPKVPDRPIGGGGYGGRGGRGFGGGGGYGGRGGPRRGDDRVRDAYRGGGGGYGGG